MNTMQTVVLIAHTFIALMIIVLVLLQRGKGADAGAAFGAGASGTVFGARGSSNFFSRATAILATAFFASSLALAYLSSQDTDRPQSLIEGAPAVEPDPEERPAEDGQPEPPAPDLPALDDDQTAGTSEGELPALEPQDEPAEPAPSEDDQGPN
jgi:preprotein translocase subunit SecG